MPTIKKYIIKPDNVKNPFQMRATSPAKYKQDLAIVKAPNVIEGGKPSYSGQGTSTSASSAVDINAYSQGGIPSDFATSGSTTDKTTKKTGGMSPEEFSKLSSGEQWKIINAKPTSSQTGKQARQESRGSRVQKNRKIQDNRNYIKDNNGNVTGRHGLIKRIGMGIKTVFNHNSPLNKKEKLKDPKKGNVKHAAFKMPIEITSAMSRDPETNRLIHNNKSQAMFETHIDNIKNPQHYVDQGMSNKNANIEAMKNNDYFYSVGDSIQNQQGRYNNPSFIQTMQSNIGEDYTNDIPMSGAADFLGIQSSLEDKNELGPFGEMNINKIVEGHTGDPIESLEWSGKERDAKEGNYIGHKKSKFDSMFEDMGMGGDMMDRINKLKNRKNNSPGNYNSPLKYSIANPFSPNQQGIIGQVYNPNGNDISQFEDGQAFNKFASNPNTLNEPPIPTEAQTTMNDLQMENEPMGAFGDDLTGAMNNNVGLPPEQGMGSTRGFVPQLSRKERRQQRRSDRRDARREQGTGLRNFMTRAVTGGMLGYNGPGNEDRQYRRTGTRPFGS